MFCPLSVITMSECHMCRCTNIKESSLYLHATISNQAINRFFRNCVFGQNVFCKRIYFLQIRYTAFKDRPPHERQAKFIASLREGHTEIVSLINAKIRMKISSSSTLILFQAFISTGFNLVLAFNPAHSFDPRLRHMDWEKEPGKVRDVVHNDFNSIM